MGIGCLTVTRSLGVQAEGNLVLHLFRFNALITTSRS